MLRMENERPSEMQPPLPIEGDLDGTNTALTKPRSTLGAEIYGNPFILRSTHSVINSPQKTRKTSQ